MSDNVNDSEAGVRPANDPFNPETWPEAARLDPPFASLLGAVVISATPDRVEAKLLVRPELLNRNGFLHGGAIMAVADNLGDTTAFMNLSPTQTTTTIESKSNFFKAVSWRYRPVRLRTDAQGRPHDGSSDKRLPWRR